MPDRAHVQRTYLRDLADWARREAVSPAAAVAGLAGVAARAERWPSTGLDAIERLRTCGARAEQGQAGRATARAPDGDGVRGRSPRQRRSPGWRATALPQPPAELDLGPSLLGSAYEAVLDVTARRARGAYFTPPLVARRLLDAVLDGRAEAGPVVDPAVGGGAFLLAAADRLVGPPPAGRAVGCPSPFPAAAPAPAPATIVRHHLHGADIDPVAVAVTRLGLGWWAWRAEGGGPDAWPPDAGRYVLVGDALLDEACWPEGDPAHPGVVVGNPPFLGQLSRRTARSPALSARLVERLGPAARGYVDGAALFLLAACRRGLPGCRIGLILPESVLVTAHADAVRREVLERGRLLGLWLGGADVFRAGVHVCAPIVELGDVEEDDRPYGPYRSDRTDRPVPPERWPVRAWRGVGVEPCGDLPIATADLRGAPTWGALTAPLRGVPSLRLPAPSPRSSGGGAGRLGDLARATAGFRDQFYGLRPHVLEGPPPPDGRSSRSAPLVTSGLIDPARCHWGRLDARFAGRRFRRPAVDLDALAAADERLAAWVGDRLRPKVLLATQGKVLEAVADPDGRLVPSVPVVAVEPADPADVWRILAVLCSPVATAWALGHYGGAGLSTQSIKLSARQVLTVPTPPDGDRWAEAAASCRSASEASAASEASDVSGAERSDRYRDHLGRAAVQSCRAYGVASDEVRTLVRWWERRMRWEDPEILRPSP